MTFEICSFCSADGTARTLVASPQPGIYICANCVTLCTAVIQTEQRKSGPASFSDLTITHTPRSIAAKLNEYIIGQDQAKKQIAVAAYNHMKRLDKSPNDTVAIKKSNILLLGPTGCGKTLFAQSLARILSLPITIGDATSMTATGYVGEDVEHLITRLYIAAKNSIEMTERGIVYVDEIDKLAKRPSTTRDVGGEGVQQGLLKLVEGSEIHAPSGMGNRSQVSTVPINTAEILFIGGGAFQGLAEIIERRIRKNSGIGFGYRKTDQQALLKHVTEKDFEVYGLIPELVGRLPIVVTLDKLSTEELVKTLTEPKDALVSQYVALFQKSDVELSFSNEALYAMAEYATNIDLGARALRRVMENILLEPMFDLGDSNIKQVHVDLKMVETGLDLLPKQIDFTKSAAA